MAQDTGCCLGLRISSKRPCWVERFGGSLKPRLSSKAARQSPEEKALLAISSRLDWGFNIMFHALQRINMHVKPVWLSPRSWLLHSVLKFNQHGCHTPQIITHLLLQCTHPPPTHIGARNDGLIARNQDSCLTFKYHTDNKNPLIMQVQCGAQPCQQLSSFFRSCIQKRCV